MELSSCGCGDFDRNPGFGRRCRKASGAVAPGFEPQVININTPKGQDINMTICIIPGSQHHHENGGFF